MTTEEELLHLNNMIQEINEIEGYARDMDANTFAIEDESKAAIMSCMQRIGEAAMLLKTDESFQDRYQNLDLEVLERLSDAGFNEKYEISAAMVWNIVDQDMPEIKEKLHATVEEIQSKEDIS